MQNLQHVALHGEPYRPLRPQWGFRLQMAQSVIKTVMARCQRMVAGDPWFRVQGTTPHLISSGVATISSLGVHGFSLNTLTSGLKNEEIFLGVQVRFSPRRVGFDR